ncbi:MAG: Asp-tRNA(Asn)/Glu-tRNA(Gln) amidotransferase subunit GatC [Candidatus Aenigmarchaeota archaeon]|nr:Asp-tRNA(Asn)/Glu-tRNA(Gln) amidotransferase subunit GatC [Candidatus Aenigmarchaeota archaeon]
MLPKTKKKTGGITPAVIEHVASLARLDLTEDEKKRFLKDLNEILAAFRVLDSVDTKNVEPSFQPLPLADVLREDSAEKCITQERALFNTDHKEKGFFKGPKVV